MFGKSLLGKRELVFLSAVGALTTACLDRPLCGDCRPETTNQFVMQVPTDGINKIDLLFMIDNSGSMADKQKLLRAAVPSLLSRFVNPLCVDDKGVLNGSQSTNGHCDKGSPEFPSIGDIHIGVITSSLGVPGGSTNNCPRTAQSGKLLPTDDRAWLLPKARADMSLRSWNNSGFLAWDPKGNKNNPAGTSVQGDLARDFQDMVAATGEVGCGYEASLESWYRFLVDPAPPASSVVNGAVSVGVGRDDALLAQRAAFLRPDSLVAIMMLTDENDCSLRLGSSAHIVDLPSENGYTKVPPPTSICESKPNDPCCRSCGTQESAPPAGCGPLAEDSNCKRERALSDKESPNNLRCFDQKRRFGADLLEPVEKYVQALTANQIPDREGTMQPNPLLAPAGKPPRDPKRVFLAGIIGVPWQDIATKESLTGSGLRYMTAAELRENGRWDVILGDPKTRKLPTDPHMIESIGARSGTSPIVMTSGAIAPTSANSPTADAVSGHEQNDTNDLQYACIFELETPVQCDGLNANANCDCKATDATATRPLCQPPSGGAAGTTQYYAKAYPGLRHLEVLKGLGDQAIVASICPKVPRSQNPDADANYGYNPAVAAIVDQLRPALANRCLPRAPTIDADGHTSCAILETRFTNDCDCTQPGRSPANDDALASVRANLERQKSCGAGTNLPCENVCACQINEAEGAALDTCRSTTDPSVQAPAYCYVDPAKNLGPPVLVQDCPATEQRLMRFVGPETPRPGSLTFMACRGQTNAH